MVTAYFTTIPAASTKILAAPTKACGETIANMEPVSIITHPAIHTTANGETERRKARVFSETKTEKSSMTANGRTTIKRATESCTI